MTACPHASLPHVTACCADDAAILALSISRSIASGYMTGDVACWDVAYGAAEEILGHQEGAALVGAITSVVRAIRCERQGDWSFMPATCCRLTPDEQDLVAAFACGRRQDAGGVAARAARLARCPSAPRLSRAIMHAALTIERAKDSIRMPARDRRPAGAPGGAVLH